jgi:hypothetical protein
MSGRVKGDPTLRPKGGAKVLQRPVVIIDQSGRETYQFLIFPDSIDAHLTKPEVFGVLLSDLLDHIASTYSSLAGKDEAATRTRILQTMLDEDALKQSDPSRGNPKGAIGGQRN